MKTIHIAGGGLAGLSLALGLRRHGVPVVLHEAGQYPRHRVCGEFILGVKDEDLAELDLTEALADAQRFDTCAWYAGNRMVAHRQLPMAARTISRHRLDDRLAAQFEDRGGMLRTGDRVEHPEGEGWVQSTGRLRMKQGKWVGLKAHYFDLKLDEGLEMHLGSRGYVGLTPVEDGRVNVCALLPHASGGEKTTLLPRMLREIGLSHVAERLEQATVDPASITGVHQFATGFQPAGEGNQLRLGDSHSLIPPFTGAGMSMAFESAARALPWLVRWAKNEIDWSAAVAGIQAELQRHFNKRMFWAGAVHRALLSRAGPWLLRLGVGGKLVPFDSLVRVLRGA